MAVKDAVKERKKLGLLRISCESDLKFYGNKHFSSQILNGHTWADVACSVSMFICQILSSIVYLSVSFLYQ